MKGVQTINNNTTNNITNNIINVNALGKEDKSYVTTKMIKQLWKSVKSGEEGFVKTIKLIHGSKNHPENHNIIYTNLRSNSCYVKDGEIFEYKNINEVLKDVGANTLDLVLLNDDYDGLPMGIKAKYEKVCEEDELNMKATIMAKTELYNSYKNGDIKRPHLSTTNLIEA